MSKASWDPAGLARAQVLDADEPGLQALARGQRAAMAQTGAVDGGQAQADAPDPAVSAFAASGARSLVYSGDGTGSSRCAPRSPPTPAPGWSARRKAARCSW